MYASRLETQSHYVLSHSFSWQLVFMRVCCSLRKLPPGLTSSQQDSRCLGHQQDCLLALSRLPCTQVSPHILFSQAHLLSPRFGAPQKPFPQPRRTALLGYLQDLWHKHQARCLCFFLESSREGCGHSSNCFWCKEAMCRYCAGLCDVLYLC